MRTFLTIVLPLIAPTVLFLLWSWMQAKRAQAEARHEPIPSWQTWPWGRLLLIGALLSAATLGTLAILREGRPGMEYVPPHTENGELVPGKFVPVEEAGGEGGEGRTEYQGYGTAPPSLPNEQQRREGTR